MEGRVCVQWGCMSGVTIDSRLAIISDFKVRRREDWKRYTVAIYATATLIGRDQTADLSTMLHRQFHDSKATRLPTAKLRHSRYTRYSR